MNLQTRPREQPEVNLTSLIDVVLLLLVFFMVSTSFVSQAEISINLPQADTEPVMIDRPESLAITVTARGTYLVNDRLLVNNSAETLRRAIDKLVADDRDLSVTIRADAETTHQSVVTAMDVIARLGFEQVNIATVGPQDAQ